MLYQELFSELKKKIACCFDDSVSLSYPVPEIVNGISVDRIFLYRNTRGPQRTRPFAVLTAAADDGRLLELTDCRYRDFVDSEAYPFSRKLDFSMPEKGSIEDFEKKQRMLREMYETIRLFAFREDPDPAQRELLAKYRSLFVHAVPRDLLPFYRALSPRFEDWAQKTVGDEA